MASVFHTALLGGAMRGLGALALSMDKSVYRVGEAPSYTVSGAVPSSALAWSSTRDGVSTGENQTSYGQTTDAQGVWSGGGNAWSSDQLGWWTKTAIVGNENATRSFQVVPANAANNNAVVLATAPQAQTGSWWSGSTNVFGYEIPTWAVYGGAALLAYILLFKKR